MPASAPKPTLSHARRDSLCLWSAGSIGGVDGVIGVGFRGGLEANSFNLKLK